MRLALSGVAVHDSRWAFGHESAAASLPDLVAGDPEDVRRFADPHADGAREFSYDETPLAIEKENATVQVAVHGLFALDSNPERSPR